MVSEDEKRRYEALVTAQHNGRIERIQRVRPTAAPAWYVVWTSLRAEKSAADGLKDIGFSTFLPTSAKWSTRRGQKSSRERTERPLFPGYVFVGFDPSVSPVGFDLMRETDDVAGILTNNGLFLKVPSVTIEAMMRAHARGDHDATIGEAQRFAASLPKQGSYVRMKAGVFEGLYAFVESVHRAAVTLALAGSSLTVEMPAEQALEGLEPA